MYRAQACHFSPNGRKAFIARPLLSITLSDLANEPRPISKVRKVSVVGEVLPVWAITRRH
jgi:hypothetical protein